MNDEKRQGRVAATPPIDNPEEVLMENVVIRLSPAGFEAFVSALEAPPAPVPELVELLKRRTPWEPGSHLSRAAGPIRTRNTQ